MCPYGFEPEPEPAGEGTRVWSECLARSSPVTASLMEPQQPRYGTPLMYRPRLGQGIFRVQVLDAYQRACAVTREHSLVVLGGSAREGLRRGR